MAERSDRTPAPAVQDAAEVEASLSADRPRRRPWRPRWPARPRRPPWWEVPPQGYLEVESRHSPTSPRVLRTLAKAAVRAGLCWDPGNPLPVQRFVEAQERARLVFQARRELPRVTAVASQVMLVESRLTRAEEALRQAVGDRSSMAATPRRPANDRSGKVGSAEPTAPADDPPGPRQRADMDAGSEQPARPPMLDRWSEAAILVVIAGGQAVLAYTAARDRGLGIVALGWFAMASAGGSILAAQLAARGIHQLGATAEGALDPRRRRHLDVGVAGGALACGVTLATAIGQVGSGAGPPVLGLALLGLATAASYAANPRSAAAANASRWRSVMSWLWRYRQERRRRRDLRAARDREAATQAAVRQLREELAVLVPQLFAAERSALLFWRYQVAIGDATQRGFEQHLAACSMRRSRGVWRPIAEWWHGASPTPFGAGEGFVSVGSEGPDWAHQVAQVTMAAKRVLVRRGLLDITHGLRVPSLPGGLSLDGNGSSPPARSNPDPVSDHSHH
jgi:hypothetical protein